MQVKPGVRLRVWVVKTPLRLLRLQNDTINCPTCHTSCGDVECQVDQSIWRWCAHGGRWSLLIKKPMRGYSCPGRLSSHWHFFLFCGFYCFVIAPREPSCIFDQPWLVAIAIWSVPVPSSIFDYKQSKPSAKSSSCGGALHLCLDVVPMRMSITSLWLKLVRLCLCEWCELKDVHLMHGQLPDIQVHCVLQHTISTITFRCLQIQQATSCTAISPFADNTVNSLYSLLRITMRSQSRPWGWGAMAKQDSNYRTYLLTRNESMTTSRGNTTQSTRKRTSIDPQRKNTRTQKHS